MAQVGWIRALGWVPLSLVLAIATTGCEDWAQIRDVLSTAMNPESESSPVPAPTSTAPNPDPNPTAPTVDDQALYDQALKQATSAVTLGQTARSPSDWELTVLRWEQAIASLKAIPAETELHATAQTKIAEYEQNLTVAQQRANQAAQAIPRASSGEIANLPALRSGGVGNRAETASEEDPDAVTTDEDATPASASDTSDAQPTWTDPDQPRPSPSSQTARRTDGVYLAQIVRRAGGTPVIEVVFNDRHRFEMIVDTGASGTVITQNMANRMGIRPIGSAVVSTASESGVTFPIGRVSSVEVDGAVARNLEVAIAPNTLEAGLLGNDFFQQYDIIFRQDVVEFRER